MQPNIESSDCHSYDGNYDPIEKEICPKCDREHYPECDEDNES